MHGKTGVQFYRQFLGILFLHYVNATANSSYQKDAEFAKFMQKQNDIYAPWADDERTRFDICIPRLA